MNLRTGTYEQPGMARYISAHFPTASHTHCHGSAVPLLLLMGVLAGAPEQKRLTPTVLVYEPQEGEFFGSKSLCLIMVMTLLLWFSGNKRPNQSF
eukprot:1161914-Pelagomonas_calceolata.AAC.1